LQGHSLGCTKAVHYLVNNKESDIFAAILLAPTDMVGWAKTDKNNGVYLKKAKGVDFEKLRDTTC
jgi:predicted alpha/beta hydrolase family esterase